MAFIGIDLGTSFIKAAILDIDARRLEYVRRLPFPQPLAKLDSHYCEFDPAQVMDAVKQLIRETEAVDVTFDGVLLCNQMSCLVMMNDHGKPISNLIGWRDQRVLEPHPSGAGSYIDILKQRISPEQRHELGNEMPPGSPAAFLFWMAERGKLDAGSIPVSLGDFVLSTLCESQPGVEHTNAMAYELLNLKTLRWHKDVIKQLGLEKLQWPTLRQQGEIVGYMDLCDKSVPCYTPVGDYQCALAGALLSEKELSLNVSTGSQVSRLRPELILGDFQTRPFFDGKFTNTFSHLPAGRSLNVLVDLLVELANSGNTQLHDPWNQIVRAVELQKQTDLKVDLSFFPGPCGDVGRIANVRENNLTVGTLFRAAFDNMASNYLSCALQIWPERLWHNIVFSGGLARKVTVLRDIIERRFETESRLCPEEEDTLLGLLILGLAFSHRTSSVEQAMIEVRAQIPSRSIQLPGS